MLAAAAAGAKGGGGGAAFRRGLRVAAPRPPRSRSCARPPARTRTVEREELNQARRARGRRRRRRRRRYGGQEEREQRRGGGGGRGRRRAAARRRGAAPAHGGTGGWEGGAAGPWRGHGRGGAALGRQACLLWCEARAGRPPEAASIRAVCPGFFPGAPAHRPGQQGCGRFGRFWKATRRAAGGGGARGGSAGRCGRSGRGDLGQIPPPGTGAPPPPRPCAPAPVGVVRGCACPLRAVSWRAGAGGRVHAGGGRARVRTLRGPGRVFLIATGTKRLMNTTRERLAPAARQCGRREHWHMCTCPFGPARAQGRPLTEWREREGKSRRFRWARTQTGPRSAQAAAAA
jgi:hypothetical protein